MRQSIDMDPFKFFKSKTNQIDGSQAVIIPIASGKGGVGKSFMSANLAIALAELGEQETAGST